MIIDVSLIHDGFDITVKSNAANYSEIRRATVGLSKGENEEFELIEGVGEVWTTDELKRLAFIERGNHNRSYRVINPFSLESFEVAPAFMTVRFYCLKSHSLIRPKTYQLRALLRFDTFELKLKLPNYNFISADKRGKFEKELRKITKRVKIEY